MRAEKSLIAIFFILIGVIPLLSMQIDRMEPAFWWTDMQNSELQIMVYGENIAQSNVEMEYPGVLLKEVVRLENPNYLFLYLDISKNSKPGILERSEEHTSELQSRGHLVCRLLLRRDLVS